MVILCYTQYYNKIKIRKYANNKNKMYVTNIILCKIPIYLRILFYWAIKLWSLRRNKCENVHYWKKQKKRSKKTLTWFSL